MKEITLRIRRDGSVEAETHGIKGRACLDWIGVLEQLLDAKTVDSSFTAEYDQVEVVEDQVVEQRESERG
jgi:hypothetical protein